MKVLEKGTGQRGWAKEFTCTGTGNGMGGCGAKLLVEQPDLFRTSRCDYTGDCDHFTTFQCAECGVLTDVSVPGSISTGLPTFREWKAQRAAADPIEEAQQKSQPSYQPSRF